MSESRADPEPLTVRQAEWLQAVREHFEKTGTAASRLDLATAMGCTGGTAAYACEVLVRKGYLFRDRTAASALRYVPAVRPPGDVERAMTADQWAERILVADDRTQIWLCDAIEAELVRRERIAAEMEGEGRGE